MKIATKLKEIATKAFKAGEFEVAARTYTKVSPSLNLLRISSTIAHTIFSLTSRLSYTSIITRSFPRIVHLKRWRPTHLYESLYSSMQRWQPSKLHRSRAPIEPKNLHVQQSSNAQEFLECTIPVLLPLMLTRLDCLDASKTSQMLTGSSTSHIQPALVNIASSHCSRVQVTV